MPISLRHQSHIVVADTQPHDYCDLAGLASIHGWHVHLLTNAAAALRLARSTHAHLWIVNVRLPDMSGFDLFEMLRDQLATVCVFIVADQYDAEHERRACRCGAALFLCKGSTGSIDCSAFLDSLNADGHSRTDTEPIVGEPELLLRAPQSIVDP